MEDWLFPYNYNSKDSLRYQFIDSIAEKTQKNILKKERKTISFINITYIRAEEEEEEERNSKKENPFQVH